MSNVSGYNQNMEYALEDLADKERSWDKKMEKSDKRMDIITNLNKKVLNDMDELRATTNTLIKKSKEDAVGAIKSDNDSQNNHENNIKHCKTKEKTPCSTTIPQPMIESPSFSFTTKLISAETLISRGLKPDQAHRPTIIL